MYRKTKSSKA